MPEHHVAIWTIELEANATWLLPETAAGINRNLYFYEGASLSIADTEVTSHSRLIVQPEHPAPLQAGPDGAKLLLLQGKPINEPVAQHGPFVMNTRQELQQAYRDYQRTGFGGWPWQKTGPVHPRNEERFAVHADGRKDVPT